MQEGSVDWFKRQRDEVRCEIGGIADLGQSLRTLQQLLRLWDQAPELRGSLYLAAAIQYCRPFNSRGGKLKKKAISGGADYNGALHAHILQCRDQLLAHSDKDVYRPTIGFKMARVDFTDSTWPRVTVPVACTALTLCFEDVQEKDSACRFRDHVASALETLERSLAQRMEHLCEVGIRCPAEFASMKVAANPAVAPPVPLRVTADSNGKFDLSGALDANYEVPERLRSEMTYTFRETKLDYKLRSIRIDIPGKGVIEFNARVGSKP